MAKEFFYGGQAVIEGVMMRGAHKAAIAVRNPKGEIVVGQPPLLESIDENPVELRFFFCGVQQGEPSANSYAEIRWIEKGHLTEYDFDAVSKPIADWLMETRR